MSSLAPMFNPRGIAIIGASPEATRPGAQTVNALLDNNYAGGIYPVNPKYPDIRGVKCYATIAEVPDNCDVAVIALPAALVCDTLIACGRKGIRFAVVLGGGFRETGEAGRQLEEKLLATAREAGVRVLGPNCLGFTNIHNAAYACFGSISKPPRLPRGAVSAVIQSGGFGNSIVMNCGEAGIGFRYVVASGNETDLAAPELINAYVDDPETKVIFGYLEGFRDGRAFVSACQRALAANKPVVIWKAGNTRQGQRAAASHTANMTGAYDIYRTAFRTNGVVEVHDIVDAIEFIKAALILKHEPKGHRAVVFGGSGGSSVVFADAADQYGIDMTAMEPHTLDALSKVLPNAACITNPIDYAAGFLTDKNTPHFIKAIDAVLADPNVDQIGALFATATGREIVNGANALAGLQAKYAKPIYAFCSAPREVTGDAFDTLEKAGIPNLPSPVRVARVMALMANRAMARARIASGVDDVTDTGSPVSLPAVSGTLSEHESKQTLAAAGVRVTTDIVIPASELTAAAAAALKITYPVALKIVSRDIAHKSDVGGVKLGIGDAKALQTAVGDMLNTIRTRVPDAKLDGLLVSEMITDGLETIVGVINDLSFGPVVAFGLGGVLAETLKDVTYRLAPFSVATARDMIGELRASAIFKGLRGAPPRDTEALAELLSAVSKFAWAGRDRLEEMDVNPVLVRPEGKGVVAADALIVLR